MGDVGRHGEQGVAGIDGLRHAGLVDFTPAFLHERGELLVIDESARLFPLPPGEG